MRKKIDYNQPSLLPWRTCKVCGKTKVLVKENFGPTNDHCFLWACRECIAAYGREYRRNKPKKEITDEDRIPPENDGTHYKICTKCGVSKLETIDNFGWRPRNRVFRYHCRECECVAAIEYTNRNYSSCQASWRKRHEENKDKVNEQRRQRRAETREKEKAYWEAPAKFETHADKLTIEEDPKEGEDGILLTKCAYCGRYFVPTNRMVRHRIVSLNDNDRRLGERRLYCSDGCKNACPIYGRQEWPKDFKPASSREVDPIIRQMCLERDNYTCQKCEKTIDQIEIHSHHIEGAVQMPLLANDVDNTITLCKPCHQWVHRQKGCTYYDLRCKK